jgi:hypothetical protein
MNKKSLDKNFSFWAHDKSNNIKFPRAKQGIVDQGSYVHYEMTGHIS